MNRLVELARAIEKDLAAAYLRGWSDGVEARERNEPPDQEAVMAEARRQAAAKIAEYRVILRPAA